MLMLPDIMKSRYMYKFLLVMAGIVIFGDVFAIDGNYAAPYGSQWDSRSQIASIPLETILGALLVVLNVTGAAIISLRTRKQR
jgi:hypothetical protein